MADINIAGYEELADGSRDLFDRIGEDAQRRFDGIAGQVADTVAARVPRLSGALAASVTAEREGERVLVGLGGDDTPYAGWIDFGGLREGRGGGVAVRHYFAEGRYLYPAALNAEPTLAAAAADAATEQIGRFRWEKPRL